MAPTDLPELRRHLLAGQVIPAHPLALDSERRFDERHMRALTRYYLESGAGGLAVGVHTTQFSIREHGLFEPVLSHVIETTRAALARAPRPLAMIAGAMGPTAQAVAEAETARALGYDAVLLSLGALAEVDEQVIVRHCAEVAEVLPLVGFYLQPAVGGRDLSYAFWRQLLEIDALAAIKIAPFDPYRTLDVVRAVADAGRADVALYTGNDDAIVADLLTPFTVGVSGRTLRIAGGLLGQWAVWTRRAVELMDRVRAARAGNAAALEALLSLGSAMTDANGALFDVRNGFAGCIAGIHEVLRRQGLMATRYCLDPNEDLSPGQLAEIERVLASYPMLRDDDFVAAHLDAWLA